MEEICMLTLYKQHYMDCYKEPLASQISCFGYYDGIDITRVKIGSNDPDELGGVGDNASISNLWYHTGVMIKKLSGGYSNQNIGIFRCGIGDEWLRRTESFWGEEDSLPFWIVGFIKLKNTEKYNDTIKYIEEAVCEKDSTEEQAKWDGKICKSLIFSTFDNADLILLMKGNSISKMEEILQVVEALEEVQYLHSIFGVEERYLKECYEEQQILRKWNKTLCFIDEEIECIGFRLATSGGAHFLPRLKGELSKWNDGEPWKIKGYEKMEYSYAIGHENINIFLPQSDVKSLLVLLLPGGFVTHQNALYNSGLYNIESYFCVKTEPWCDLECKTISDIESNFGDVPEWCRNLIRKYDRFEEPSLIKTNLGLDSYFQTLIQTLNTLDQYEHFQLSNDIFHLIYRSFKMFDQQLSRILERSEDSGDDQDLEKMKESMCLYLESVNSVVYHTIHTDQVYLMIPGYAGTSFSIPIKLNLFYLWFVEKVIDVMNDNQRNYSCILTPVMESKPMTATIGDESGSRDKLICVRLSQRSLFFPDSLMIILCHEMGHYVGKELRNRKIRAESIIKTMAYFITEMIFPENRLDQKRGELDSNIYNNWKQCIRDKLLEKIMTILINKIREDCSDKEYHSEIFKESLQKWSIAVIRQDGCGAEVCELLKFIPGDVWDEISKNEKAFKKNMQGMISLQKSLNENRELLLSSTLLSIVIQEIMKAYQEVFADMAALAILDCDEQTYKKAFCVSEGVSDVSHIFTRWELLRQEIANNVVFEPNGKEVENREMPQMLQKRGNTRLETEYTDESFVLANIANYMWVKVPIQKYAKLCYDEIGKRLKNETYEPIVRDIRKTFNLFNDRNVDISELFGRIIYGISDYANKVQREYESTDKQKTEML